MPSNRSSSRSSNARGAIRANVREQSPNGSSRYAYTDLAKLQRELGELGEVLPRLKRGSTKFLAQGWYALLPDGSHKFLGDHVSLAFLSIAKLKREAEEGA